MSRHSNALRRRRGITLIYGFALIMVMIAFASLAVDYGRLVLVRHQLSIAANAAARAAAGSLTVSTAQARQDAIAVAALNLAEGSAVTLLDSDIVFGNHNGSTFTANATPTNAVRVNVQRTQSRGNALSLTFGRLFGRASCDATVSATCKYTSGGINGFIGASSLTVKNNAFIASYSSATTTDPSKTNHTSAANVASNGLIDGKNNNTVKGSATLGPDGEIDGFSISGGSTSSLDSEIETPAVPTWNPGSNPGGISKNYTVNSSTNLAGGTYWFTSLTVSAPLNFTGPAILIVNGDVEFDSSITSYQSIPSNLVIYQLGSSRTFGDNSNGMSVTAKIVAPGSAFTAKNNLTFRGSFFFDSVTLKNNGELYYDTAMGPAISSSVLSSVQ